MKIGGLLKHKIVVWGYGLEGRSAVDFLIKNKYDKEILVVDSKKIEETKNGVKFILEDEIFNYDFDFVIKSSGVSYYKENIKKILEKNIIVSSILNILLAEVENKKVKTIAITGTKGKTTTVSILSHVLKNNGYRTAIVGNIGYSYLDIIDNIDNLDYIILEVSSYQATNMLYNVDYVVVLNLFREHIDWHQTHEKYYVDKMNILNHTKNKIVNYEDVIIKKMLTDDDYIFFNKNDKFHISNEICCYNNEKIFNINDVKNINGEHIFKNICSILTILKQENFKIDNIVDILKKFKTLEHRLEIFYENKEKNIVYVDDSISTIPEATIECLKTFTKKYKNILLIIGGFDRQQNYDELINYINLNIDIKVYLIGQTGKRLKLQIKNANLFDTYENMIKNIKNDIIYDNTAVILSPASPSYDMFKNFEERGEFFKKTFLL